MHKSFFCLRQNQKRDYTNGVMHFRTDSVRGILSGDDFELSVTLTFKMASQK